MRTAIFIGPTLRSAQGAAQAMREETRGAYVRLMSANLAATGLQGYGPHAELYLYESHRIPAATWDAIQTCVSKGATITRIGEQ